MDEIEALLNQVLGNVSSIRLSYAEVFQMHAGLNPHSASIAELDQRARQLDLRFSESACGHRDDYLNLIISHCIAPQLGWDQPVFVYDFPASQKVTRSARRIGGLGRKQRV